MKFKKFQTGKIVRLTCKARDCESNQSERVKSELKWVFYEQNNFSGNSINTRKRI